MERLADRQRRTGRWAALRTVEAPGGAEEIRILDGTVDGILVPRGYPSAQALLYGRPCATMGQ